MKVPSDHTEVDCSHLVSPVPELDCLRDCPQLGACCRNMSIHAGGKPFPRSQTVAEAQRELQERNLPFEVIGFMRRWHEHDKEYGYSWRVGCTMVLPDGLCAIYGDRPDVCKGFKAGSEELCILHSNAEKLRATTVVYPLSDLPDGSFASDIMRKVYGPPLQINREQ